MYGWEAAMTVLAFCITDFDIWYDTGEKHLGRGKEKGEKWTEQTI
jgi:hypothetical protein